FFQAEDGIRDGHVTGVQTCALPIFFLGVENVDDYYQQLKERGAQVQPPIDEGWGGRFITVQDPDKYRFFFVTWSAKTERDFVSRSEERRVGKECRSRWRLLC